MHAAVVEAAQPPLALLLILLSARLELALLLLTFPSPTVVGNDGSPTKQHHCVAFAGQRHSPLLCPSLGQNWPWAEWLLWAGPVSR
jgi:hypothetical protein